MKTYVFFYHYNKPASQQRGKPVISVHYRNKCLLVDNLVCNVKTWGHINKKQPRFVIKGKASKVEIVDNVAHIS